MKNRMKKKKKNETEVFSVYKKTKLKFLHILFYLEINNNPNSNNNTKNELTKYEQNT